MSSNRPETPTTPDEEQKQAPEQTPAQVEGEEDDDTAEDGE